MNSPRLKLGASSSTAAVRPSDAFVGEATDLLDRLDAYASASGRGQFYPLHIGKTCFAPPVDLISLANIFIMFVNNNPKIVGKSMGTTQNLRPSGL